MISHGPRPPATHSSVSTKLPSAWPDERPERQRRQPAAARRNGADDQHARKQKNQLGEEAKRESGWTGDCGKSSEKGRSDEKKRGGNGLRPHRHAGADGA